MQRLLNRQQFQAVMASAPVAKTEHFALHRASLTRVNTTSGGIRALFPVTDQPWLGVVLPKRCAKRAVTRNTLRRQIYAVAAEQAATLPADALVVRLRATFSRDQFHSPTSAVLRRAARAELLELFAQFQARRAARAASSGTAKRPVAATERPETGGGHAA